MSERLVGFRSRDLRCDAAGTTRPSASQRQRSRLSRAGRLTGAHICPVPRPGRNRPWTRPSRSKFCGGIPRRSVGDFGLFDPQPSRMSPRPFPGFWIGIEACQAAIGANDNVELGKGNETPKTGKQCGTVTASGTDSTSIEIGPAAFGACWLLK